MTDGSAFPWLAAFGLMLVFEGLLPLLVPTAWKDMMGRVLQFRDGQIRFVGLISISVGLLFVMLG